MAYTLMGGSNPDNEPENTIREYYQRSFNGEFMPAFEEGCTGGHSDLEDGGYDYRDILRATPVISRDLEWHARLDGYRSIIEPHRGPLYHIGD